MDTQKSIIRREVKTKKADLSEADKLEQAKIIYEKIEQMPEFKRAKSILMYWSLSDELPTHDFIKKWNRTKTILLPVVKNHHMTFRPFISEDKLLAGGLNIMEPKSGQDYLKNVDLAIIPGVAFDKLRNRLGRGKGYYDKYLRNKRIIKWGLCFNFQLYDKIPATSQDIKMNKVITPYETIE
ncbi:MAG: 5-formyltetrahydrofolate cyclo-ligase [Bacteroidales bacterium 36-12]|nr:MAG: 5-formyltetrahydrofolate cyclo-ligase [Bacteroidales bacterium 36-12]